MGSLSSFLMGFVHLDPQVPRLTPLQGGLASPLREATTEGELLKFYRALTETLGPMNWWPAKTPFEVIVGAILTQNTAWTNVKRAIENLRAERLLSPLAIEKVSVRRLARLVRPSGYFRQKSKKLKSFVHFLRENYSGSLAKMFRTPTAELRDKLLAVHGIGPETADSILLYAGNHSIFVVDAYTRRILSRHGMMDEKAAYDDIRSLFERNLPRDAQLYNEYHALIVNTGKNWCRTKNPKCIECPLGAFLTNADLIPLEARS
jgi:endonuclease-3 related protein